MKGSRCSALRSKRCGWRWRAGRSELHRGLLGERGSRVGGRCRYWRTWLRGSKLRKRWHCIAVGNSKIFGGGSRSRGSRLWGKRRFVGRSSRYRTRCLCRCRCKLNGGLRSRNGARRSRSELKRRLWSCSVGRRWASWSFRRRSKWGGLRSSRLSSNRTSVGRSRSELKHRLWTSCSVGRSRASWNFGWLQSQLGRLRCSRL